MKIIKKYVDRIDEELKDAQNYAECYLYAKSEGDTLWANRCKEMAQEELKHSTYNHDKAVSEVEKLKEVYNPPVDMTEKWNKSHKEYVERAAWIKTMLTM